MKEHFKIIKIQDKLATLQVQKEAGCNSCSVNTTCGIGILSRYFGHNSIKQPVIDGQKVGDIITLEVSDKTLFKYAFLLYLLPIILLFFGAFLARITIPEQGGYQILFGLLGLFLGLINARLISH